MKTRRTTLVVGGAVLLGLSSLLQATAPPKAALLPSLLPPRPALSPALAGPWTALPPIPSIVLEHDATPTRTFSQDPGYGLDAHLRITAPDTAAGSWITIMAWFYVSDPNYFTGSRAGLTYLRPPVVIGADDYFGPAFEGEPDVGVGQSFLNSMVLYTLMPADPTRVFGYAQPVLSPSIGTTTSFLWRTDYARWDPQSSPALLYYRNIRASNDSAHLNLRNWAEALVLAQSGNTLVPTDSDFKDAFLYGATIVFQVIAARGPDVDYWDFPDYDDPAEPLPGLAGYPGELPSWGVSNHILIQLPGASPAHWWEQDPFHSQSPTMSLLYGTPGGDVDVEVAGRYVDSFARIRLEDETIVDLPFSYGGVGIGRLSLPPDFATGTHRIIRYTNPFGHTPLYGAERPYLQVGN